LKLISVALKFNEKINSRNLEGLVELMTDDHAFVDGDGVVTKGKDLMKEAWREFFKRYPDYQNIFTCITVQSNIVVMVGYSTCSCKQLNGPNIWTAKARGKRLYEWRVIRLDRSREQIFHK
jgi:ketosteroid isomerase-like protein